ncbi:MAG: hypothetical protein ABL998_02845 [Planctomycetota bacterium]
MQKTLPSCWLAACTALSTACASGRAPQDVSAPPLSTDRPGLLFAPTLVPAGHLQLEASTPVWIESESGATRSTSWSAPIALRHGLGERVELRATLPAWTEQRVEHAGATERDEGFADMELGLKLALRAPDDEPLALLTMLRLPSGADAFAADGVGASAYLLHGRTHGSLAFSGLAGLVHTPLADADDATQGVLGVLVARGLTTSTSATLELVAMPGLVHAPGQAFVGAALLQLIGSDLQLDLALDVGLDPDAPDLVLSLGFARRF